MHQNALAHPRCERADEWDSGNEQALFFRDSSLAQNELETWKTQRVLAVNAQPHPRSSHAERRKSGKNPGVPIRPQSRALAGIGWASAVR
jgi:hypothetical protein